MTDYEMSRRPAAPPAPGVPVAVSPGASPYTYTASEAGVMYVSGGTVSLIQLVRGGVTIGTGLLTGAYFMRAGDRLVTTYVVAPVMNWVPA